MRNKSNEKGKNIIYFNKNEHRTFNKKRIAGLIILLVIIVIFIVGYILYATNEEFRTFIESKGYSLKQVSQATTLSKTVLSLWMNGEYRGKNERITALISNYLQREKERAPLRIRSRSRRRI